ncbi:MAG: sigma-70 family RNA polymerase sigma factor [Deltaproteobacteria bacterium]|nr:sigma-70 family RNA polymerase sigma factor [Deltaproteobacteria bacterium]
MRANWEALHQSLAVSIRTLQADQAFTRAKTRHDPLRAFPEPGALVSFLTTKQGDLDAKDRILAALVTMVQRREDRALASALLWLGLWPGLDAAYRRRIKHFASRPEELVSEIADVFAGHVERLNFETVSRVAATLVRSTERDVMERRRKVWAESARIREDKAEPRVFDDFVQGTEIGNMPVDHWTAPQTESRLGLSPGLGVDQAVAALRAWLEPIVGEDAELLVAVLVLEETQREAGERLGLSHDAARKRFQRALERVRQQGLTGG